MNFFQTLIRNKGLSIHDRRPLWKYFLSDNDFELLCEELKYANEFTLDPRSAALYYAEWWKRLYNGGIPNKMEIFLSIGGNFQYQMTPQKFYELAKKGGQMLGFKWIVKQNTLRFKTLLLQGGLPLKHISDNESKYSNFLMSVLEQQPDTIEDFIFQNDIVNLLPKSSQNDIVYENCLEIVKSILNKESIYDELLESNDTLKNISGQLKVRAKELKKEVRLIKPKNYWVLKKSDENVKIQLTLGLAEQYSVDSLKNILGMEIQEREYQFYLNDKLICVFRKMINGKFKTDWFNQQNHIWEGDNNIPNAYVITGGIKIEVNDFIQSNPSLEEPSLWSKYSENEWRLIKGNGSKDKSAALLFPKEWCTEGKSEKIEIQNKEMKWEEFEGELQIKNSEEFRKYYSNVESFDWVIVSEKPGWMTRANMPVIKGNLKLYIYDPSNNLLPSGNVEIWIRPSRSNSIWQKLNYGHKLPLGCIDLKIISNGLTAYDLVYNIGKVEVNFQETSIRKAKIQVTGLEFFEFQLNESELLSIDKEPNYLSLNVSKDQDKIPTVVEGSIGYRKQRKLFFQMRSPFQGMALIDGDGQLIGETDKLSLRSLYGLRVLSTPKRETILRLKNKINPSVKITKTLKEPFQPLIAFKDEIIRLYYLADAMDFQNRVCIELKEGFEQKSYEISGFSHFLDITNQDSGKISLYQTEDQLELFGIPLVESPEDLIPVSVFRKNGCYEIPYNEKMKQWIIISSKENGKQLMPRFVNTDSNFLTKGKDERIENYSEKLLSEDFESEIWQQLLALFNICSKNAYDLPFSTFDQFRSLCSNSKIAARAFLFLGVNQIDRYTYLQKDIPEMEKDLGICFHWVSKSDWEIVIGELCESYGSQYLQEFVKLISEYLQENELNELVGFIFNDQKSKISISHREISDLRAFLGERVLNELPDKSPRVSQDYNLPIQHHQSVRLLLQSPIAVAESIKNIATDYPIWGLDDIKNTIRRNIQYSQYLNPKFYNKAILHVLKN